jgi:pantoate--beta-alanine ligase
MQIVAEIGEMQRWSEGQRRQGRRVVLVPTMGFLHDAHLELVREGRKRGDLLVVSIFVNPVQFSPGEDLASYPRDFEKDRQLLAEEGVDLLFYPKTESVYPPGFQAKVEVGELSRFLCGPYRPGHFQGVAIVVAKLFNMVRPHVAVFGLKDYQQFLVIRRLVEDMNFDIELVGYPIVREADGLAMSSRNSYLNEAERRAALCLSRALKKAQDLVQ